MSRTAKRRRCRPAPLRTFVYLIVALIVALWAAGFVLAFQ